MALLNKKLKIKKGTLISACNIYSTKDESGTPYLALKVDGVKGFVALKNTNDANATSGRVKISSNTYAIATQVSLPYEEKSWTTPGTYTWTCPQGVTKIKVAVCGGGGGSSVGIPLLIPGKNGGDSSFDTIIATGGKAASQNDTVPTGGTPNGYPGVMKPVPKYTDGFALNFVKQSGTYGRGGGFPDGDIAIAISGSSGGYDTKTLNVTANKTYQITVGAGGAQQALNPNKSNPGTDGFVLIAWGGDIA